VNKWHGGSSGGGKEMETLGELQINILINIFTICHGPMGRDTAPRGRGRL
jgi:hypothetical protein